MRILPIPLHPPSAPRSPSHWTISISHGQASDINIAAKSSMTILVTLGLGSPWPIKFTADTVATQASSRNSNAPATRAAGPSLVSHAEPDQNLHSTTTAEASSMMLSPPKARSVGLQARHTENNETTTSTNIQTIVKT